MSRIEHIEGHPAYRQLVSERRRLGLSLAALTAVVL
jgi:hypothetical protein